MRNAHRRSRGFTLVELMMVVAIIGILSSIALPVLKNTQLRAKQTERSVLMTSIHRAMEEYWLREGHYPLVSGSGSSYSSWLYLFYWNPDSTPGTTKRAWRQKPLNQWDHWNSLGVQVEGNVYYSYYGYAYDVPNYRYSLLQAIGDLDGDGVQDQLQRYWYYENAQLLKYAGYPCSDCTYEFRFPDDGRTF